MDFTYTRPETGLPERVRKELWHWEALYNDETALKQFDEATGLFHQLREIDQTKLSVFKMSNDLTPQVFTLIFDPRCMELIHVYKQYRLAAGTESERRLTLYVFGYKKRIGKFRIDTVYMCITPSGELVLTDNLQNLNVV